MNINQDNNKSKLLEDDILLFNFHHMICSPKADATPHPPNSHLYYTYIIFFLNGE